jgi:predicted nuclease of predicted toxin-antitoxin system
MRLLFDQNLSRRLVERLALDYPGAEHVLLIGLDEAADQIVWNYAASHGFTIVTKDKDFIDLSNRLGHPPKVIWLRTGNAATCELERLLILSKRRIESFYNDPLQALLELP